MILKSLPEYCKLPREMMDGAGPLRDSKSQALFTSASGAWTAYAQVSLLLSYMNRSFASEMSLL